MKKFPWGKVTQIHTIGNHEITEYVVAAVFSDKGETCFHVDDNYGISFDTLDEAILASLCLKHGGNYEDINYAKRVMNWKD